MLTARLRWDTEGPPATGRREGLEAQLQGELKEPQAPWGSVERDHLPTPTDSLEVNSAHHLA